MHIAVGPQQVYQYLTGMGLVQVGRQISQQKRGLLGTKAGDNLLPHNQAQATENLDPA
jgi:hypothetical protein